MNATDVKAPQRTKPSGANPPDNWELRQPFGWKTILILLAVVLVLGYTARNTEMDRMVGLLGEWAASIVGAKETSQVGRGVERVVTDMFPLRLSEEISVGRIENFDREDVRWPSRVETRKETDYRMNPESLNLEEVIVENEVLIKPLGYLMVVLEKMVETIEIAIWGTIVAILVSIPLAFYGARNYSPHPSIYFASRSTVSFCNCSRLEVRVFLAGL